MSSQHLVVLGASGRTGGLVIDEALSRGHTVTALVRHAANFEEVPKGLTLVEGSPLSSEDILRALSTSTVAPSSTAVVLTLNNRRASDSPFAKPVSPPRLLADSGAAAARAMKAAGVRKFVSMSAFGVADSSPEINFAFRFILRKTNMAVQFADHDALDAEMKERSDYIDFVLPRPVMLKEGETLPVKEFGDQGKGAGIMVGITRKSVAAFMVDAVEQNSWNGHTPVISN